MRRRINKLFDFNEYQNAVRNIFPAPTTAATTTTGATRDLTDVGRNLRTPITANAINVTLPGFGSVSSLSWGSSDEFIEKYRGFDALFRQAVEEELGNTAISSAKKRMLQLYRKSPVINLNILSYQNRQMLRNHLMGQDVLQMDRLVSQFGLPGHMFPSDNLYRFAGRMVTDSSAGAGGPHPLLSLLRAISVNIDPLQKGMDAISIGVSNLPSATQLESQYRQGSSLIEAMQKAQRERRAVKLFIKDTETTGIGSFSQIRSYGAVSADLYEDGFMGEAKIAASYHMSAPDMSEVTMHGRPGTPKTLADLAFREESSMAAELALGRREELMDLTTVEGRRAAATAYKDILRQALDHDYIVAYNAGFDIEKTILSAGMIDEFYNDREAMDLLQQYTEKVNRGEVIDPLNILRESQERQIIRETAGMSNPEVAMRRALQTSYGPQGMSKLMMGTLSPVSIENALLSSNLLDLMYRDPARTRTD